MAVDCKVDFNLRLRGFRVGSETPAADGVLSSVDEESVAGFDLGVGDGAVGLDLDQQHDFAADVHAVSELGVDRGDAADDRSMDVDGEGSASAKCEASQDKERM